MTPPDARLLASREVERLYRLRHGTVNDAVRQRRLTSQKRGKVTYVSAKHADEIWGLK